MRSDQLSNLMSRGLVLSGYEEAQWPPPFPPTYKCRIQHQDVSLKASSASSGSSSSPTQSVHSNSATLPDTPTTADYDESRVPSYTDRILFKSKVANQKTTVKCLQYTSVSTIDSSDHKPVYALFEVDLESGGPRIPRRLAKSYATGSEVKQVVSGRKKSSNSKGSFPLRNRLPNNETRAE